MSRKLAGPKLSAMEARVIELVTTEEAKSFSEAVRMVWGDTIKSTSINVYASRIKKKNEKLLALTTERMEVIKNGDGPEATPEAKRLLYFDALERAGMTTDRIAAMIAAGCEAKLTGGRTPNWPAREKFIRLAMMSRGDGELLVNDSATLGPDGKPKDRVVNLHAHFHSPVFQSTDNPAMPEQIADESEIIDIV